MERNIWKKVKLFFQVWIYNCKLFPLCRILFQELISSSRKVKFFSRICPFGLNSELGIVSGTRRNLPAGFVRILYVTGNTWSKIGIRHLKNPRRLERQIVHFA